MGLLSSLFGGLFGDEEAEQQQTVEHPCSNCPSNCALAPDACSVCKPYKEQMIEAIYRVEHMDEIVSQYEVTGTMAENGTVVCPHCGGHSDNHYKCDYCGSSLQEGGGKIQVASAADIPNPILEAQDIIFDRQAAVREFTRSMSGEESGGFLSSLFDSLFGMETTEESISIGKKMTESEIREMADYFDVSVSDYLSGLDNGKYPTLSNKASYSEIQHTTFQETPSSSSMDMMSGLAGLAGALGLGSAILGGTSHTAQGAYKKPANMSGMGGMNLFGFGNYGAGMNASGMPPMQQNNMYQMPQQRPQVRPVQPQQRPEVRPVQPQQRPEVRPVQQQPRPVAKPAQQPRPAAKPAQQAKPAAKPVQQPKPGNKPAQQAQKNAGQFAQNVSSAASARKPAAPKNNGGKLPGQGSAKPGGKR